MPRPPLTASFREATVISPTVGTWVCEVAPGTVLRAGLRIGRLRRADRWQAVLAPVSCVGHAVAAVAADRVPVEHGSVLLELGDPPEHAVGADQDVEEGLVPLSVGMTGAVYLRPSPDRPLFAPTGAEVEARDVVALIEVMKTYNPVKAPRAGTIARWLVEDGATVEPGDVIVLIRPV